MSQPQVTGVIKDWYCVHYYEEHDNLAMELCCYAYGTVVVDHRKRFAEGKFISTSHVRRIEHHLAYTLNSVYELQGEGEHFWVPIEHMAAIESMGLHPRQCTFKTSKPLLGKRH